MAHLGADLAAFVDGQLPGTSMDAARRHLEGCDQCRLAVRQQERLKSRMRSADSPQPPASLLASLSRLEHVALPHESRWQRLVGSTFTRAAVAVVGASIAIAVVAYAVGGPDDGPGDPVVPAVDQYATQFVASAEGGSPTRPITVSTMDQLDSSGWPCHEQLAGDLQRVGGQWVGDDQVVSLAYTNGTTRLSLFEQTGRLDAAELDGFEPETIANARVWVRAGYPYIVAWDSDGVVYTLVTDASRAKVAEVVAQLPNRKVVSGPSHRISDGLDRMTTWLTPAA